MLCKKSLLLCLIVSLVLPSLLLSAPKADACGGLFCTTKPVDQTAERIIFKVNKTDETITAVVGIAYTGNSSDFSWVVPVPNPPQLDVAETKSLDALSTATNLQFNTPPDPCPRPSPLVKAAGGAGGPDTSTNGAFLQTGQVGPYNYAIIRNEKTDEMIAWLRDNGYQITKPMEPLVNAYVKEGKYFLAMRLQPGKDVQEIKPIVMTYKAIHPMIPIRLTAVAAVDDMQILVWILGDSQYIPDNYAHPTVDFTTMRAGFQQIREGGSTYTTLTSYKAEQKRLQTLYHGLAYITEYAQPTPDLIIKLGRFDNGNIDKVVANLITQSTYVTRLRAQMSPDQMTLDPTFVPNPSAPDVSNVIDVAKYVDAPVFWGCPK